MASNVAKKVLAGTATRAPAAERLGGLLLERLHVRSEDELPPQHELAELLANRLPDGFVVQPHQGDGGDGRPGHRPSSHSNGRLKKPAKQRSSSTLLTTRAGL